MGTNGKNRFGGIWRLGRKQAELTIAKTDDIIIKKELTERTAFENYDPTTELKEPLPVELKVEKRTPKPKVKSKWKVVFRTYHISSWKNEDSTPKHWYFDHETKAKNEKHARQIIEMAEGELRRQWQQWSCPAPWWKLFNGNVLVDCSAAVQS